MATPNNVTPTNCSWWPISALENDAGKSMENEEIQDPAHPAFRSKDRLVLYHWTQSFSSQKVKALTGFRREGCQPVISVCKIPGCGGECEAGRQKQVAAGRQGVVETEVCLMSAFHGFQQYWAWGWGKGSTACLHLGWGRSVFVACLAIL